MPIKVVSKGGETTKDVLLRYQKKLGETIGNYGGLPTEEIRIPTGLFPLDLGLGGGFPKGRCSIIYGPEDSGKTSVAYKLIANHQRLWPDEYCVFIAIEPFDPGWAKKLGVDLDKLIVLNPLFAEEAADMAGDMLEAEDVGLVVLDSVAAMITTQEAEKSAEGHNPGNAALAVGKMVRRTALAMRRAERDGRSPSLVYINQTRFKIGVMFGNPEIMPGGNGPLFQSQMTVRFYGKAVKDSKVSDTHPIIREINYSLKKYKVPVSSDSGVVKMVTFSHNDLHPGDTDDINTITAYLKDLGDLVSAKKGYEILGVSYPTIAAFKARVVKDRKFGAEVRDHILATIKNALDSADTMDTNMEVDEDGVITSGGG